MREKLGHLGKGVAIYGAGDAAVNVVNFLLLAVYVKFGYLDTNDYGAIAIITAFEGIAKIVSRLGLDGAFMRHFHDRAAGGPLERMASTIVWFLLGVNILVFAPAIALSGWVGDRFMHNIAYVPAFRLMLINTFLISLTFVPFHLMRLRNEAVTYSGFVFARSAGTTLLRGVLVMGLGWGFTGWYAADLILTLALWPLLWRWMSPVLTTAFDRKELATVLRFGLPRLPHGIAQQALEAGNKMLLKAHVGLEQVGVYQNGFTLGTGIRFFTSAFETAWAPFYYATAKQPDARTVLSKTTTYGVAVLTLLVATTVAVSHDVILVILTPTYLAAVPVIPLIAIGMAAQGLYLFTSIGLNLTSKTQYYPVATFAALAVGLGAGALLMPRFGMTGAAVAFALSGATQTLVAFTFARRFYPIQYEIGRLARVVAAGALAAIGAVWLVPDLPPVAGLVVRGLVTTSAFGAVLLASGFFRKSERDFLNELVARFRRRPTALPDADAK
ncbi:MAG TPA: lipopolysaccharide biosynthesis protein [Vicinamibacterales bacterium]|nr:lipopolysaccharide biosynthesis protein [Vicinamibacterales bacterium]